MLDRAAADDSLRDFFDSGRVELVDYPSLGRAAWAIADRLGWARTYDAEYVALAQLLGGVLVTRDLGVRRGADRLGFVLTPQEFLARQAP